MVAWSVTNAVRLQVSRKVTDAHAGGIGTGGKQDRSTSPVDGAGIQPIQRHQVAFLPGAGIFEGEDQGIAASRTIEIEGTFPAFTQACNTDIHPVLAIN